MAGNVAEWVQDEYISFYTHHDGSSQAWEDPDSQLYRVTRGGSYQAPVDFLRTRKRASASESVLHATVGFRCAQNLP
jgi:formylglycine-generating enzyme required for sulfatase activity